MADDAEPILSATYRGLLDAITARLIPRDATGPGAREARVIRYIERALASDYRNHLAFYLEGLANVDSYTQATHGKGFVDLSDDQQDEVLKEMEAGRAMAGPVSLAPFFALVLAHTLEGMFGDPQWGGNDNFVGWKLIHYPGPRYLWQEADQRLDAVIEPRYRSQSELIRDLGEQ